jgi:3-oxoacyl-[acyl-carrier protein] reductase
MASEKAALEPGYSDRVVIITGAGQGIGRVLAHSFAAVGAIPVIAEINKESAQNVANEIEAEGGSALALPTDVGNADSVQKMVERVLSKLGRIDVLINNAAIFSTLEMRPFDEIPLEEWEHVIRINITGAFLCSRAVVPTMRKARWGRIIHMASGAVTMGRPGYLHYIASKSALAGMARSMARELGSYGITVNAILPGATFTEIPRKTITPEQKEAIIRSQCIPRAETPEDLAGTVLFLASEGASFLTGQGITVDGGNTHT